MAGFEVTEKAWWTGSRMDGCPRCGSRDCGTIGDGIGNGLDTDDHNRTDANLSDIGYCEDCGWESIRPMYEAEEERLRECDDVLVAPDDGSSWHSASVYREFIMEYREERRDAARAALAEYRRLAAGDPELEEML